MEIWHNNRCSKSRAAVEILNERKVQFEEFDYLKASLKLSDIKGLLKILNIKAEELVRKAEPVFKEKFKGKILSDNEWMQAMVENPKLIQRPILINNGKAVIGRPPENILSLL